MEQGRRLGFASVVVPPIGQGTWKMGAARDRAREVATLRRGLELGLTHIDTAELYGDGRAEEMIAEALAGSGRKRDEIFLVSKVLPRNAGFAGTIAACDASLRRLRTDYLDVYLLHWPGPHPIEETMRAFEHLVQTGKIRFLGVSNFDVEDLEAARRALTRERIVCNQVLYHLGERGIERRVLPYCEQAEIAVVGYSPFGSGVFPSPRTKGGRVLDEVAARHGATARQVALAFLVRRPSLFAIPKASTTAHVEDNAGTLALELSREDAGEIDRAFPTDHDGPLATL
jgi:diketogulonate reductase-like aldo/keto reductase